MPPDDNIQPLNAIDDPFINLTDKECEENSIKLQQALIVRSLVEDLSRGMYSIGRLREKYIGSDNYQPYPWLTLNVFKELLEQATRQVVSDNPIDPRFEITGYLSSNLQLQQSMYDMLDEPITVRVKVDIIRTLNQLKKERVDFMRSVGVSLAEQAANPSKPSMLPPGAVKVTDIIAEGAKVLEHTTTPTKFTGILTSGSIAGDGRDRSTSGDVENE